MQKQWPIIYFPALAAKMRPFMWVPTGFVKRGHNLSSTPNNGIKDVDNNDNLLLYRVAQKKWISHIWV